MSPPATCWKPMPDWPHDSASPVRLSGLARERGRGQVAHGGADADKVRAAIVGRVERARAEGLFDGDADCFLAAQRRFAEESDPHSMAELAGIAEGFGMAEPDLFAHLHLSLLRDRRQAGTIDADGCSAWAVGHGPDGPLLVKNRDFSGTHLGIQRVFGHEGPDIASGAFLCVGSLGAPGAYSSGINAAGLALADTVVSTRDHGMGWLRYFLMTRILAECASVAEALTFIRARSHAGGGTLVLADRGGAVAAVELGHRHVSVEEAICVFRTNHFVSRDLGATTLPPGDDRIAANSRVRFDILAAAVPATEWSAAAAASLMARHPLCQHGGEDEASTIAGVVFACATGSLYLADGNPCRGRWTRYTLDP